MATLWKTRAACPPWAASKWRVAVKFVASAGGCDTDIIMVEVIAGTTVRQNFEINCAPSGA
jgi:hypothetical protein